jgi:hypothetical protein
MFGRAKRHEVGGLLLASFEFDGFFLGSFGFGPQDDLPAALQMDDRRDIGPMARPFGCLFSSLGRLHCESDQLEFLDQPGAQPFRPRFLHDHHQGTVSSSPRSRKEEAKD